MAKIDTLAFLDAHGRAPVASPEIDIDVAHVTAAPPFFPESEQILNGAEAPNGAHIPGINGFRGFLEQQKIIVVRSAADLEAAGDGQLRTILGLQGSPTDADHPDNLERFYDAGLRTIGLGYEKGSHSLGAGFSDNEKHLDARSKDFVSAIGAAGLILDLSHSGHQAALDALEHIRDNDIDIPVFASHTGVREVTSSHNRNFPPEVLQGIKERGGTVGVYALTFALHDSDNSLWPMLANVHAAVDLLGSESVTIGSDGIYQTYTDEERRAQYEALSRSIDPTVFSARFPSEPDTLNTPKKMEAIESALRESDRYTDDQLAAIIGGNALRFFQNALR